MMGPIRGGTSGQRRRRQDTERPEKPTETADKAEKGTDIVIIIAGKPPPKKPSDDPAGGRGDFKQPKQELENGALLDDSTGSQDHSGHSDVLDTDMLGSALPEGGGKTEKEMATKKGGVGLMYLTAGLWYGRVCVNTRQDLHMGGMDPGTEWCTMYIRTNASTFGKYTCTSIIVSSLLKALTLSLPITTKVSYANSYVPDEMPSIWSSVKIAQYQTTCIYFLNNPTIVVLHLEL